MAYFLIKTYFGKNEGIVSKILRIIIIPKNHGKTVIKLPKKIQIETLIYLST